MASAGGRPWSRFSSKYATVQLSGVAAATLVRASVGREHVFAEAAARVLGIKGVDHQRVAAAQGRTGCVVVEGGRFAHFAGQEKRGDAGAEGEGGINVHGGMGSSFVSQSEYTLLHKVSGVKSRGGGD